MTFNLLNDVGKLRLRRKRRKLHAEAQRRHKTKRHLMSPEDALKLVLTALTDSKLTRKVLGQKVKLFGKAMDAVLALGVERQLLNVREGSNHPIGGGPVTQFWSLREGARSPIMRSRTVRGFTLFW